VSLIDLPPLGPSFPLAFAERKQNQRESLPGMLLGLHSSSRLVLTRLILFYPELLSSCFSVLYCPLHLTLSEFCTSVQRLCVFFASPPSPLSPVLSEWQLLSVPTSPPRMSLAGCCFLFFRKPPPSDPTFEAVPRGWRLSRFQFTFVFFFVFAVFFSFLIEVRFLGYLTIFPGRFALYVFFPACCHPSEANFGLVGLSLPKPNLF